MSDRVERLRRLTPEQTWQIFLEVSRKNTTDAEVCGRWGITPWQLRAIRERAKDASVAAFGRGPGRGAKDPEITELRGGAHLQGAQGTRDREHAAAGKVNGV